MSQVYNANVAGTAFEKAMSHTDPTDGDPATAASIENPGPLRRHIDVEGIFAEELAASLSSSWLIVPTGMTSVFTAFGTIPQSGGALDSALIAVGPSGFIASCGLGRVQEASGWSARTSNLGANNALCVAANSSIAIVGAAGGVLASSPDSITWIARTANMGTTAIGSAVWNPTLNLFAICGGLSSLSTSPDGITWTSRTIANA